MIVFTRANGKGRVSFNPQQIVAVVEDYEWGYGTGEKNTGILTSCSVVYPITEDFETTNQSINAFMEASK